MIYSIKKKKSSSVLYVMSLLPVIMPILSPYAISDRGNIKICDVIIILVSSYLILKKRVLLFKPLFAVLVIDFLLTIISMAFTSSTQTDIFLAMKVCIVFCLYLMVYSSIWTYDITELFFNWIKIIGLVCAILGILQFSFASFGIDFYDGKLFLPLGENNYFGGLYDINTGDLRVHSFFEESSYLAIFELPITCYLLKEKRYIMAVICAISCVISGSIIGIAGVSICVLFMVFVSKSVSKNTKVKLLAIIIICILFGIYLYNSNNSIQTLIDYYIKRGTSVEYALKRSDSSFSQRIFGNIGLFNEYDFFNRLVGVGFNQYSLYFGIFKDYSNDFVSNLLNFGYIGLITMISALICLAKNSSSFGRVTMIIFVLVLAIDHSWFGCMFFYLVTWIIALYKSDRIKGAFLRIKY